MSMIKDILTQLEGDFKDIKKEASLKVIAAMCTDSIRRIKKFRKRKKNNEKSIRTDDAIHEEE